VYLFVPHLDAACQYCSGSFSNVAPFNLKINIILHVSELTEGAQQTEALLEFGGSVS
jgi:hypothetical protein